MIAEISAPNGRVGPHLIRRTGGNQLPINQYRNPVSQAKDGRHVVLNQENRHMTSQVFNQLDHLCRFLRAGAGHWFVEQ